MKKVILLFSIFLMVFFVFDSIDCVAQKTEKEIKKEMKRKPIRTIRKEAKKLVKDGWNVSPGSPAIEKMLEQAQIKQFEEDEKGNPKYITADGNSIAGNQTAAEMQAIETAKFILAGMLETRVAALVSNNIANVELSDQEAETITEMIANSKNIIAKNMGYINPFFKITRRLSNGNVEAQVKLFYNAEEGDIIARKAIKEELKEKLKANEEDLKKLMGM